MAIKSTVLWVNLGSPDSPSVSDVRRYLAEFLMDPCVIDVPWVLRALIVYLTILPSRPTESAEAYDSIWTEDGSPLLVNSYRFFEAEKTRAPEMSHYLAMRYANPSILSVVKKIKEDHPDLHRLVVVPLYPQYAMSSTKTVELEVQKSVKRVFGTLDVQVVAPFYADKGYQSALVQSIKPYVSDIEHLLVSYHGLPERHLVKTDPTGSWCLSRPDCCEVPHEAHHTCYRHQCFKATSLFLDALKLDPSRVTVAFQSRLGKDPWLRPFTDESLVELAKSGVKKLHVVCPAFVSDCLETLEEIKVRGRETFIEAGGQELVYIPCLNDSEAWVEAAVALLSQ